VKGLDMAAGMASSEVERSIAMPLSEAMVNHIAAVSGSRRQPDQAIADALDLLHRLTNLVEALGNITGPHPVTNCAARKS
jgi:hypothetical protein